ncbi:hypothetical protein OKW42_003097 [Paraburkholderia sp. WC7.3d]
MRAGANRAAEQRFGLTVSKESGHYIFRLRPRRLIVGHRGMPPSPTTLRRAANPRGAWRRYHADFRNPPFDPARSRMRDAAWRNR